MAVNQKVYLEECLIKQLLSFIKKYHSMIGMYFSQTCVLHIMQIWYKHGFRTTTYIPKTMNVANVPEICTVEDYWGFLKRNVYKNTWQANNLDEPKKKS